jgi:hypothetical protein
MKKLFLCWVLFVSPLHSAEPPALLPESLRTRTLTDRDITSMRAIASSYPCAMLTLAYVMRGPNAAASGVLYIDEIPTSRMVSDVLDDLYLGGVGALGMAVQANLYSDARTFTELRWSTKRVRAGTWRLQFRAELLARMDPPLVPRHVLETAVEMVVTPDEVQLHSPPRHVPASAQAPTGLQAMVRASVPLVAPP